MEYNFQGFIARVLEFPIDVMLHFFLFVFYSSLYAEPSTFQIFYYAEPSQSVASFICNSVQRVFSVLFLHLPYPFCFFGYTDERCPRDCNRPLLAKILFSRFAVKRILRQTIPHITYCLIMLFCCFLCGRDLPGYNRTG